MEKLFVIDPTNYKGNALATMSEGTVDCSGYLYNNQGPDLSLEDYKERVNNPNLIALTYEQYETQYLIPFHKTLMGPWKEITEERYEDMFEALPPLKYQGGPIVTFFLGECFTHDLYTCCLHDKLTGKYYSALRSINTHPADLRSDYAKFIEAKS